MTISQIDGVEHKKGNNIPGSYVIMKYNMFCIMARQNNVLES